MSGQQEIHKEKKLVAAGNERPGRTDAKEPSQPAKDAALERVMTQIAAGNYQKAVSMLATAGQGPEVLNARGVCLLRLERYEEAVRLFRGLVLQPGGTWARTGVPNVYKTNFATALLLDGHPGGCLEVLSEVRDKQFPPAERLLAAIKRWEKSLSLWQRFNWWLGRIEPEGRPVSLDFEPGDFEDGSPTSVARTSASSNGRA